MGFINLILQVRELRHNLVTSGQGTKWLAELRVPFRLLRLQSPHSFHIMTLPESLTHALSSLPSASGSSFKPHSITACHRGVDWSHTGSPESTFCIHYHQHNQGCLIAFDFLGTRNIFPKLLIESGSHLLLAGKPSVCQGSSSVG